MVVTLNKIIADRKNDLRFTLSHFVPYFYDVPRWNRSIIRFLTLDRTQNAGNLDKQRGSGISPVMYYVAIGFTSIIFLSVF